MAGKALESILMEQILPRVTKPGTYVGSERNIIRKDPAGVRLRVALAFPDTYAVGMSHLGLKILYHILNSRADIWAERVFAPWIDMEEELRQRSVPLFSLESFTPLACFDVVGFSLTYELAYSNFLNMLDLARLPLRSEDRNENHPLVIAGGALSSALEPVAPFLDAVLVGDAEEALLPFMDQVIEAKESRARREELLRALAGMPGIYVPRFYRIRYRKDGTIVGRDNDAGVPARVAKITVSDLGKTPFPTAPVVPNVKVIHDRINIEIMRGCPHRCRFCQAVQHYRPLKIRPIEKVVELCRETFFNTGYDEVSLTSLSTADYPEIGKLIAAVAQEMAPYRVNVALPSLRITEELESLPALAASVRRAGLTLAPEVATDKLRKLVNKPVSNCDLMRACEAAFRSGYRLIKLYFMIGLPGEKEEDVKAIATMVREISRLGRKTAGSTPRLNVSVSSFVPKPHTPFQWEAMNSREEIEEKQRMLLGQRLPRSVRLKFHDRDQSYLEAVFARGDRRLAEVLTEARRKGIRMDSWAEVFRLDSWLEAFATAGMDPDFYASRRRDPEEIMPWDHISLSVPRSMLEKEMQKVRILIRE